MDVYHKAYDIIEQYFGSEDDPRLGTNVQSAPPGTDQFQFTSDQSVPMDGFNFWSLPKKKQYYLRLFFFYTILLFLINN